MAPPQFVWSDIGIENFSNELKNPDFQNKLEECIKLDYKNPNNVVNRISEVLIDVAKKAGIKTRKKKIQNDPPWFNRNCAKLK